MVLKKKTMFLVFSSIKTNHQLKIIFLIFSTFQLLDFLVIKTIIICRRISLEIRVFWENKKFFFFQKKNSKGDYKNEK